MSIFLASLLAFVGTVSTDLADPEPRVSETTSRRFHIRYVATIDPVKEGKTLRLWIPIPDDDPHQSIRNLEIHTSFDYRLTREAVFGNRMVFIEAPAPRSPQEITVEYDVERRAYRTDLAVFAEDGEGGVQAIYKKPSRLCVVNDDIRQLAEGLTRGKTGTLARARAFYDHVSSEMSYGKPDQLPWGRGDTVYACREGIGNCTDFHSYFISLCLAKNIAARFQIGLYGKYERAPGEEYETGGYHCWAEFHVPGRGWVPVDISEADKDPSRHDEFFGSHSDNRVTLSTGRDLILAPAQEGEPLNYFVNPYAEVDGKSYSGVTKRGFWKDHE